MTFLVFKIGSDRYALEMGRLAEVLPRIRLKQIPQAAPGIAGVFSYHGEPVPVVDISELALRQPARNSLCNRLLVVNYPCAADHTRRLGILVEHATETIRREPGDFQPAQVSNPTTPYLGPVTQDERGLIQWLKLEEILPASVRDQLWQQAQATIPAAVAGAGKVEAVKA